MNNRVAILTSGHRPYDERLFWKFGRCLQRNGFDVTIICSTSEINQYTENITVTGFDGSKIKKNAKINKFIGHLENYSPDIIICAEPLPVVASYEYKQKNKCIIISDITEWYPENYIMKLPLLRRIIEYPFLFLFNIYATNLANALIIGEVTKKVRYNIIAPFKRKIIIGYYPVLEFFNYNPPAIGKDIILCYAGLMNFSRGIKELYNAALTISRKYKYLKVRLRLIGRFEHPEEELEFDELTSKHDSVHIEKDRWYPYPEFSQALEDVDICFDLRKRNFIYRNSLPIKIFDYMACGKPFIYSDIKPIRKELDVSKFGFLVNPKRQKQIVSAIEKYINDKSLLVTHSANCRREIDNKKNWERECVNLLHFIRSFEKELTFEKEPNQ